MPDENREPTLSELKAGYEGRPPIPLDTLEREFPAALGFKVRHADYFERVDGRRRYIPTAVVVSPDGSVRQFFPEAPERRQP